MSKECYFYSNKALPILIKAMKHCLLNKNECPNLKSAQRLIGQLSKHADPAIILFAFKLISENLGHEDSKIRISVIFLIESILKTIHFASIKLIIEDTFPTLFSLLNDKSMDMREHVASCLVEITEYHTDVLINMSNSNPYLFDVFLDNFQNIIENFSSNKRVIVDLVHFISNNFKNKRIFRSSAPRR